MTAPQPSSLLDHLGDIADPRSPHGRRHPLRAMLAAVTCATLCGARGFKPIAQWVHDQEIGLIHDLGFTRKPPKWGAFRKLLLALPPTGFEAALSRWAEDCSARLPEESKGAGGLEPVALDGKTARGSLSRHRKAIHLLSVMAQRSGLTLIQAEVGEKTNEHKAALSLLRGLVLKGRVLTADAMFCQRDLCQDVLEKGGHYFVAVKENQPDLLRNIRDAFAPPPAAALSPPAAGPHRAAVLRTRHRREATGPGRDAQAAGDHAPERLPRLARGGSGVLCGARGQEARRDAES